MPATLQTSGRAHTNRGKLLRDSKANPRSMDSGMNTVAVLGMVGQESKVFKRECSLIEFVFDWR